MVRIRRKRTGSWLRRVISAPNKKSRSADAGAAPGANGVSGAMAQRTGVAWPALSSNWKAFKLLYVLLSKPDVGGCALSSFRARAVLGCEATNAFAFSGLGLPVFGSGAAARVSA